MNKTQTKTLDCLWSKLVKLKAKGQCEWCGSNKTLNSHHVIGRRNKATRWNESNGVCLCAYHHMLSKNSAHQNPLEFIEFIRDKRGITWYTMLRLQSNEVVKHDYKLLKIYLEKEIEKYE